VRGLALPPGWRVVALQEVEGMPHPAHLTQSQQFWWLVIPESCPPGEGISWFGAGSIRESSTAVQRSGLSHGVSWGVFPYTVSDLLSARAGESP
jgi:hypothetical protein